MAAEPPQDILMTTRMAHDVCSVAPGPNRLARKLGSWTMWIFASHQQSKFKFFLQNDLAERDPRAIVGMISRAIDNVVGGVRGRAAVFRQRTHENLIKKCQ